MTPTPSGIAARRWWARWGVLTVTVGAVLFVGVGAASAAPTPAPSPAPVATPSAVPSSPIGVGPTANPTPTVAPSGPSVTLPGQGSPGFFDFGGRVQQAINGWFAKLAVNALNSVLDVMGRTVLATPDVTTQGRVRDLWIVSAGVANTLLVLLAIAGGAVVMSKETLQTRYGLHEMLGRIVLAAVETNASLAVAGQTIRLSNAVTAAVAGQGVDQGKAVATLKNLSSAADGAGSTSYTVLLVLVVAVFGQIVVLTYIVRVALVVLGVASAPLLLIWRASPYTESAAKLWWRGMVGSTAIQLGQTLTLVAAVRVFLNSDGSATLGMSGSGPVVNLLVACCLFYVLIRIPFWVMRMIFGQHRSSIVQLIKYRIVLRHLLPTGSHR